METKKKFKIGMIANLVIAGLFLASCNQEPSWSMLGENLLDSAQTNVAFISDTTGFTGGYGGAVHYTNDGGKSWIPGEAKTLCRFTIDVTKCGDFIHAGNGGNVGISVDGGKTWNIMDQTINDKISLVSFVDSTIGYIISKSKQKIYTTTDGGKTWAEIKKPESNGFLAMECLGDGELYLFDNGGNLHYTNNNGETWSSKNVLDKKYKLKTAIYDPNAVSIRFADKNSGTIAIIAPGKSKEDHSILILNSTDGFDTISDETIKNEKVSTHSKVFLSVDAQLLTVNNESSFSLYSRI